jgi:clan AA aspartic protease (TIGR02281 family)
MALCMGALWSFFSTASSTHAQQPVPRDHAAELARLRPLADSGNAEAQFKLGVMYCRGFGVPRDPAECNRLYRLAADHGNADAQYTLGLQYLSGNGSPRDPGQANRWFRKAADSGQSSALYLLAVNYSTGNGIARDDAEAVRLLKRAAAQDNLMAITLLADMIEHGRGGPADPVEAARLWRLAASKGYAPAKEHLTLLAAAGAATASPQAAGTFSIPLLRKGDAWIVAGTIDEAINVNFILDSGATITAFPESVARLLGLNSLREAQSAVSTVGRLANGSTVTAKTFAVRSLRVGGKTIPNVMVSIIPGNGTPLLGQSFLQMFSSWSIHNDRQLLVLTEKSR